MRAFDLFLEGRRFIQIILRYNFQKWRSFSRMPLLFKINIRQKINPKAAERRPHVIY